MSESSDNEDKVKEAEKPEAAVAAPTPAAPEDGRNRDNRDNRNNRGGRNMVRTGGSNFRNQKGGGGGGRHHGFRNGGQQHQRPQRLPDDEEGLNAASFTPVTAEDLADINLTEDEKKALSSKDLKSKDIQYIIKLAEKLKIENAAGLRRQDVVFEILKRAAFIGADN